LSKEASTQDSTRTYYSTRRNRSYTPPVLRPERLRRFQEEMWLWFANHKRTLPWRDLSIKDDTQRAYMILVSEVMLQQTQVPRVEIIFRRFLEQFPTIDHLAQAGNKEVILAWRGMGYNSRALRLRDAAKTVVETFDGEFPREMDELLSIKGIGNYTAAAIRNFAFDISTPCIDTNIRRILHRVFVGPDNPDGTFEKNDKQLLPLAGEVLSIALDTKNLKLKTKNSAKDWHAALMDFGSAVCKKTNPLCAICPQAHNCKSAFRVKVNKKVERTLKQEPGRLVGSAFIPNRIFRGRIVEQLRDAHQGLTLPDIGARISVDWNAELHHAWLQDVLDKLIKDQMIERKAKKFLLKS